MAIPSEDFLTLALDMGCYHFDHEADKLSANDPLYEIYRKRALNYGRLENKDFGDFNMWDKAEAFDALLHYTDWYNIDRIPDLLDRNPARDLAALEKYTDECGNDYRAVSAFREAAAELAEDEFVQDKKRLRNDLKWCVECLDIPRAKPSARRQGVISSVADYAAGSVATRETELVNDLSDDEIDLLYNTLIRLSDRYNIN